MTVLSLASIEAFSSELAGNRVETTRAYPPSKVSSEDLARACELAERVLALQEPWCGRFCAYVESRATREVAVVADHVPSLARLAGWLLDADLYAMVRGLLRSWDHGDQAAGSQPRLGINASGQSQA